MKVKELEIKLDNLSMADITVKDNIICASYEAIEDIMFNEGYGVSHIFGLPFEFLESERDYSMYYWYFKLGDKTYRYCGRYDSWGGTSFDGDLEEVHEVQKMVTVWERI